MIDKFHDNCFGCTACGTICPKSAIRFEKNDLGFFYPVIDEEKCVGCNLCEQLCPILTNTSLQNPNPKNVYAVRHSSLEEVKTSRSGAAFIALSDVIIKKGGSVYGAAFVDGLDVKHIKTECVKERDRLKGSKYVQSDLRGVLDEIKADLKKGRCVLFSGTPCQVAGVKAAFSNKFANSLFLIDILCHGAPSPHLWKDYLQYEQKLHGDCIIKYDFRDKSINGWSDHRESMILKRGGKIVDTLFTNLFYTNSFFRDCCYECPFATTRRVGDITLGDLWGWERIDKTLNEDDKGISLVLINNDKGFDLFKDASSILLYKSIDLACCKQRNLIEPTPAPAYRVDFLRYYRKNGFSKLVKYIFTPSIIQRIKRKIIIRWKKK